MSEGDMSVKHKGVYGVTLGEKPVSLCVTGHFTDVLRLPRSSGLFQQEVPAFNVPLWFDIVLQRLGDASSLLPLVFIPILSFC